jgi:probable HAF family extracellular repeat protein
LNDTSTAFLGPVTLGSATTLSNSQCRLNAAGSSVSGSGNSLTLNLAMTFFSSWGGGKWQYLNAEDTSGVNSGYFALGTWTVPGNQPPTADSVAPSSGSGFTQTFALQYSDPGGASNLATTWVWFNATQSSSSSNSCLVYYAPNPPTSWLVYLLNDAGTAWTSATIGAGGTTLQNSQCAIDVGASSAVTSGNTLTFNLAMTFKPAFGGAKNVYMYAANRSGANSGWNDRGDWTVPVVTAVVTADSVTPASGSGTTQTFALQYSDTLGAADLSTTWVWFNATFSNNSSNSCMLYYNRAAGQINMLNDAGTTWMPGTLGSATTLQNNQCSINLGSSSVVLAGNTLTLNLAMTFKPAYAGAKNVYMYATNGTINSDWNDRGDWTVPVVNPGVTSDSVTPASGNGVTQTFALQYSDTLGAADLSTTWVWFTTTFSGDSSNSCLLYYNQPAGQLNMLNDAGTTWMPGTLGSATTLQNNQCSINLGGSSLVLDGNIQTLNLAMTFKPAYAGAKNVYMYATNGTINSGWQDRGDWTVPGTAIAVTADSVAPNNGSGATQLFALQYSDTLGATDLSTVWVWFTATFSGNSGNSCLLYYNRPAAQLNMLNDAGTTWMPGTLGSGAVLQNSQCAVALTSSSVTLIGNTLTLNLSMSFKSAYPGAKNVYMYATNGTINSGWQDRGDWTVPGVSADSVTPASGSALSRTFALLYSDSLGANDLSTVWVWFNATFASTSANSCLVYYDRAAAQLNLINDAGTAWIPGTLGAGAPIQNSQCVVGLSASSVTLNGNTLTLNLAMMFKSGYSGAKNVYMYGDGVSGATSDWQDRGDWTVPAPVNLGTLGGSTSVANAVNDNGQVVGQSQIANGTYHPFSWTAAGGMVDLGSLGGSSSALKVGASGQVIGYSYLSGSSGSYRGFTWSQAGGFVDLTLGGTDSDALDVGANGQVAGWSTLTGVSTRHAFSWTPAGGIVDLGTLGGTYSNAYAVSNGQVVGYSATANGWEHAFLWTQAGGMVDLGTLGGNNSTAYAVNDNGQVVGQSQVANGSYHAFSWTAGGGMVDLGTTGVESWAKWVSANGQVVGVNRFGNGSTRAFAWTPATGMVDVTPGNGSTVNTVNAQGQVVGQIGNSPRHAYSWTPLGGMVDLGTLVGGDSNALAVNAAGQVAGSSTFGISFHPFVWTRAAWMVDLGTLGGNGGSIAAANNNCQVVGWSTIAGSNDTHAALWNVGCP